jgi:hypothetical protein
VNQEVSRLMFRFVQNDKEDGVRYLLAVGSFAAFLRDVSRSFLNFRDRLIFVSFVIRIKSPPPAFLSRRPTYHLSRHYCIL